MADRSLAEITRQLQRIATDANTIRPDKELAGIVAEGFAAIEVRLRELEQHAPQPTTIDTTNTVPSAGTVNQSVRSG